MWCIIVLIGCGILHAEYACAHPNARDLLIRREIVKDTLPKSPVTVDKKALCDLASTYITLNNSSLKYKSKLLSFYKPYLSQHFYQKLKRKSWSQMTFLGVGENTPDACEIKRIKQNLWSVKLRTIEIRPANAGENRTIYVKNFDFLVRHLKQPVSGNYAGLVLDGFFSEPKCSGLTPKQRRLYLKP